MKSLVFVCVLVCACSQLAHSQRERAENHQDNNDQTLRVDCVDCLCRERERLIVREDSRTASPRSRLLLVAFLRTDLSSLQPVRLVSILQQDTM